MALSANLDELNDLIYQRINKGIESFFTSLITAFGRQRLSDVIPKIYIILAGNSSASSAAFNQTKCNPGFSGGPFKLASVVRTLCRFWVYFCPFFIKCLCTD